MTNLTFNGVGLYLMVCELRNILNFVLQPLSLVHTFEGLFLLAVRGAKDIHKLLGMVRKWNIIPHGPHSLLVIFDVSKREEIYG